MARSLSSRNLGSRLALVVFFLAASYLLRSCKTNEAPPKHSPRSLRSSRSPHTSSKSHASPAPVTTSDGSTATANSNDGNLLLGNPTKAGTDENNFLLTRPQYTMSYNRSRGGSNWVAWHTDASDLGELSRGKFRPDPDLPESWQITPNDYTGSGYDRGHVCPSGDRTARREDNDATFYMSNMLPQTAELNQHVWADFEDQCRDWVRNNYELYIVAGGVGEKERIGQGKVAVPKSCWKIVVALPLGTGDLARIKTGTKVASVWMDNDATPALEQGKWQTFRTTPAQIERATGFQFFSALPKDVASALRKRNDEF